MISSQRLNLTQQAVSLHTAPRLQAGIRACSGSPGVAATREASTLQVGRSEVDNSVHRGSNCFMHTTACFFLEFWSRVRVCSLLSCACLQACPAPTARVASPFTNPPQQRSSGEPHKAVQGRSRAQRTLSKHKACTD